MSRIKQLVTQGGADTFTAVAINTGLVADGKAGWNITAISAFWDGKAVAAADFIISAQVATIATVTAYGDADEVARVSWGLQNTAGVAVAVPFEPIKFVTIQPRLTVQPAIYAQVSSITTGAANAVIFVIEYEVVKLTDLEVLRMLAGGA
jgi:hypothetical protein